MRYKITKIDPPNYIVSDVDTHNSFLLPYQHLKVYFGLGPKVQQRFLHEVENGHDVIVDTERKSIILQKFKVVDPIIQQFKEAIEPKQDIWNYNPSEILEDVNTTAEEIISSMGFDKDNNNTGVPTPPVEQNVGMIINWEKKS